MIDEKKFIGSKTNEQEFDIATLISSWSNHYISWKKFKKNYLLIKYEDLLKNPKIEFFRITKYLETISNFKFDNNNIKKTIIDCDFENLKNKEIKEGFVEATKNQSQKFFYLGPKNNWKNFLKKNIRERIELVFNKEMKDLNYL